MSGVAITASKSVQFSDWILLTMSSPPTKSAPASCASRSLSPLAITSTFFDLPSPFGMHDGAADHLVGVLGIDAETHVHFDGLVEFGELDFLDERNGLFQEVILGFDLLLRGLILFT